MSASKNFEIVLKALPYPDQIKDIDFGEVTVEFSWRGSRYCVKENLDVWEVDEGLLCGNDKAMLLEALLRKTKVIN